MSELAPHASTASLIREKLVHYHDNVVRAITRVGARVRTKIFPRREPAEATIRARTLHSSAARYIWTTLLDPRDWVSYIYVPILVPILVLTPYAVIKAYEHSHRLNAIARSLVEESRDLEQMTRLLDELPAPFTGEKAKDLSPDDKADLRGFTVLQGLRIIDLRRWNPTAPKASNSIVYVYRRMKVRKEPGNQSNNFRVPALAASSSTQIRFPLQQLKPQLYSRIDQDGEGLRHFEVGADFRTVPEGQSVDMIYEYFSPGSFLGAGVGSTSLAWDIEVDTIEQSWWVLMPAGIEYQNWQILRYPTPTPDAVQIVKPVTEFLANDFAILAFKLLGLKAGYTYELYWYYRHP